MIADVLDLFAGPGGWSVALQRLGLTEVGVEWDEDVCRTAQRAGHRRHHGDVRYFDARPGSYRGLIASPPCQTFSTAGLGEGRDVVDILTAAADLVAARMTPAHAVAQLLGVRRDVAPLGFEWDVPVSFDERSALVLEPLRFALALRPEWVALEQVPAVLPIWQAIGSLLHVAGYSVATGVLSAEQFGVPQTRRRAVLVASRTHDVTLPRPTHSRYYVNDPTRLDPGVLPWVSMADALGWGMTARPYVTIATGTAAGGTDPQALGGSGARAAVQREFDAGRWRFTPAGRNLDQGLTPRTIDHPAHTITGAGSAFWLGRFNDQSGTPYDPDWPSKRPATTVAGRGIVTNPGENANRFNGSSKSRNDGVRVTVAEAGVLQSFPPDYPWSGNDGAQFQQVGDAVPPPLAEAIVRAAADELVCTNCGDDLTVQGEPFCLDCLEGGATR